MTDDDQEKQGFKGGYKCVSKGMVCFPNKKVQLYFLYIGGHKAQILEKEKTYPEYIVVWLRETTKKEYFLNNISKYQKFIKSS